MVELKSRLPRIKFKRNSGYREWAVFGLSILLAIFFAWFGYRIIVFSDTISSTELFLFGVTAVVAGLIISGSEHHWSIGFSVIAIGFYYFARSSGLITIPILGYVLAIASWLAGALLLYITYPQTGKPAQK